MRVTKKNERLSVQAIAGTYVVLLGMNVTPEGAKGLLGFAVRRQDKTENEDYWLKGFKTFKSTDPHPEAGSLVTTREQPIQDFHWGDYTAKPRHDYSYEVVPLYGTPKNLSPGPSVTVEVSTQNEDQGKHAVFFNRGVAGSQAFARKFPDVDLAKDPDPQALAWLSRGLEEALLAFIGQAKGKGWGLRAAVYEFNYLPVLKAFGAAAKSGADVKIIYDARPGKDHPVAESQKAITAAAIQDLVIPRKANPSYIAHNKFIVLLKDGEPTEVWTGSTNITEGGIFGHSNVGHIVRDSQIAQSYIEYWTRLSGDPQAKVLAAANREAAPDPVGQLPNPDVRAVFSPRPDLKVLQWYAQEMSAAQQINRDKPSVYLTAAFGVNDLLASVLSKQVGYLRFVMLDKPGKTFDVFSKTKYNQIAVGAYLRDSDPVGRWLTERLTGLNPNVPYLHTKYLLVDALSNNPLVVSGSANFSDNSTTHNDENMLLIQGNQDVADIYLTEFMRLFDHFKARDYDRKRTAAPGSPVFASTYLTEDDSWSKPYYTDGSVEEKARLFFS